MELYTIEELSKKVKYSVHTLYKKKKEMEEGLHYFQAPKGKILFCDEAINFFLNKQKGKHENIKRNCVQEKRKPISAYKYFSK